MIQDLDFLDIECVLMVIRRLAADMSFLSCKKNLDYDVDSLKSIYQDLIEISKSLEAVYIVFPCNSKK